VASTLLSDAKRLIDDGRTEQAIGLLNRHLEQAGDDHAARNMLAYALFRGGDLQAAEAEYRTMVAGPEPDPRDQLSLGRTLERQGRLEEAKAWIAAAAASGLEAAAVDQARLAQAAPSLRPPERSQGPLSELGIPQSEEELERFTRLFRARAKQDWWTQNWYSIPWGMRLAHAITLLAILAFIGWVFVNLWAAIETRPTPPELPANVHVLSRSAPTAPTTTRPPSGSAATVPASPQRVACSVADYPGGIRQSAVPPVDRARSEAARVVAPSSMACSAPARPAPIRPGRPRDPAGWMEIPRPGTSPAWGACISAGETITLASSVSRRIRSSLATTEASIISPSESCLVPSGIAVTAAVGDALSVRLRACAELIESPRGLLRHRDDLCIALTSRLGSHHVSGSEHHHGGQLH